jgi:hypothetical protein
VFSFADFQFSGKCRGEILTVGLSAPDGHKKRYFILVGDATLKHQQGRKETTFRLKGIIDLADIKIFSLC